MNAYHHTHVNYSELSGRYAVCLTCGWRGPDRFGGLHEPGKWEAECDATDHHNETALPVRREASGECFAQ